MRRTKKSFLSVGTGLLLLCLLAAGSVSAQNLKIGVVNMQKLFDNYWKTKQVNANLKGRVDDYEKARKGMMDDYQKAQDAYKKLLESANDQAVSAEERDRRKKAAQDKLLDVQQQEQSIVKFDRQTGVVIDEQKRRNWRRIMNDIQAVVAEKARAGNYTLVLNVSDVTSDTGTRVPFVLYSNGKNDLTSDVLKNLNAGAPPNLLNAPPVKPSDPLSNSRRQPAGTGGGTGRH